MKMYVVMGNDFPDAVFSTKEKAEDFCAKQKIMDKNSGRRIYWRVYGFDVDVR